MATVKHMAVTCGFAVVAAFVPMILAAPAQAKNCPPGTTQTKFEGAKVAHAAGGGQKNSHQPAH